MFSRGVLKIWMLVLAASLVIGPVAALASGPSAGDNQYTDPLASTTPAKTTTSPPPASTSPSTPPASTSPSTPPSAPASSGALASSSPETPSATTPTATTADSSKTLPYTGYDAWLGGALGVGLVAAGFAVRRRLASGS